MGDLIPGMVWVSDHQGRVTYLNQRFLDYAGVTLEEYQRLPPGEGIHPEDREKVLDRSRAARAQGRPAEFEFRHLGRDGTYRWFLGRMVPVIEQGAITGWVGASIDIHRHKQAEARLRQALATLRLSEERFRTALAAAPIAVYNQDRELRYTWIHDSGLGLAASEVLGKRDPDLWERPEEAEPVRVIKQRVLDTGMPERAEIQVTRRGVLQTFDLALEPVRDGSGAVIGLTGALVDITERKRAEYQLRQQTRLEAIGRLAGGIAHDLNNTLQALVGFAGFARQDPGLTPAGRADLDQVARAADRMAGLVHQLLAFSRQQVLAPTLRDLNAVVREALPLIQRLIGPRNELVLDLADEPKWVRVDGAQFTEVLVNLAVNARDAMGEGGTLSLSTRDYIVGSGQLRLHGDQQLVPAGEYVDLTIKDSGRGIPADTLEYIFDPFYTTKETGTGTGLGLATVYGVVRQSGGYVWATSTQGEGSMFTMLLPRVPAPERPAGDRPAREDPGDRALVLVVEDEPAVRNVLRRTLELEGYRVMQAGHGAEALTLLGQHPGQFALVVSDVLMPVMGGIELRQRVRELDPVLPIIFISGHVPEALFAAGSSPEDILLLQKPVPGPVLLDAVRNARLTNRVIRRS